MFSQSPCGFTGATARGGRANSSTCSSSSASASGTSKSRRWRSKQTAARRLVVSGRAQKTRFTSALQTRAEARNCLILFLSTRPHCLAPPAACITTAEALCCFSCLRVRSGGIRIRFDERQSRDGQHPSCRSGGHHQRPCNRARVTCASSRRRPVHLFLLRFPRRHPQLRRRLGGGRGGLDVAAPVQRRRVASGSRRGGRRRRALPEPRREPRRRRRLAPAGALSHCGWDVRLLPRRAGVRRDGAVRPPRVLRPVREAYRDGAWAEAREAAVPGLQAGLPENDQSYFSVSTRASRGRRDRPPRCAPAALRGVGEFAKKKKKKRRLLLLFLVCLVAFHLLSFEKRSSSDAKAAAAAAAASHQQPRRRRQAGRRLPPAPASSRAKPLRSGTVYAQN